jgi:hypothetical protein
MNGMLVRYKDILSNRLLKKKLPPRSGKQLCPPRDLVLELCGDESCWWMNMMKVKAIQKTRWPLTQKELRSWFGLVRKWLS